ncbi:MAG: hypothetical protein INR65_15450 [Gluconacetobacter diazotrophicus]|nr:hypothetical protein [Gluconacetobacter diazotrophicus]
MEKAEFLAAGSDGLDGALLALWWDARGDWERAHTVAQDLPGPDGALIHAYLHRKEGDLGNAGYWYRRAGRPVATGSLEEEWQGLVEEFQRRQA